MTPIILLTLVSQVTAMYLTASLERPLNQITLSTTTQVWTTSSAITTATPTDTVTTTLPVEISSLMTMAPLSRNPLQARQHCWNDQGFSVNCATWTGYYYTWGGSGHPYAGGPGSGSGSNGGSEVVVSNGAGAVNAGDVFGFVGLGLGLGWWNLMALGTVVLCLML